MSEPPSAMEEQEHSRDPNRNSHLPLLVVFRPQNYSIPFMSLLGSQCHIIDPHDSPDEPLPSFLSRHARSARAAVCLGLMPLTSETLSLLPSLGIIVCSSAGIEHIDLEFCLRRGITVTNTSTAFSEDVADCAVALLVDVLRRISAADRFVRKGLWKVEKEFPLGSKVGGKRVGIVGLGSIGAQVARRLLAFGCSIAYNSRHKKPSCLFPYYENVVDLAANSDVLVVCCSLTKETYHIINKDVMKSLGKQGIIINIGRGALIDEKELVQSLVQGDVGGAGLDVFENEPFVPKELFELDNVVLSPHHAVLTPESVAAMQDLVVNNLIAFFSNKPLVSVVRY